MRRGSPRRPASPVGDAVGRILELRRRAARDRTGLFLVEGVRNFLRAVEHGLRIETLVVSWKLLKPALARQLVRRLRRDGTKCLLVSPEDFRRLSTLTRASGIAFVAHQHWSRIQEVALQSGSVWLMLRDVQAPGNLGTLLRSLAAVGGGGAIFLGEGPDPFDQAVIRATMGSLFGLRLVRASAEQVAELCRSAGCRVIGASPGAEQCYDEVPSSPGAIIFLGGERAGLSEEDLELCQQLVRIPMVGGVDSLNLGVAGSLMMYEALRAQRSR